MSYTSPNEDLCLCGSRCMTRKIIVNCVLLIGTYIVPLYVFSQSQNNYANIDTIQEVVFSVMFLGAVLLAYLNHKNRGNEEYPKWLWTLFEVIGVFGIIYSAVILYLLFAFRHGIGF